MRNPRTGELRHRRRELGSGAHRARARSSASVSVVRDVTEQQRVEKALREADRRKDVFLASLSHELRNPLAPIRTAARDPRVRRTRATGRREEERGHRLAAGGAHGRAARRPARPLALHARRAGPGEAARAPAGAARRRDRGRAAADRPPAATACRSSSLSPAPVLDVDPVRFTQVVSNLLTNAAKYTNPGGDVTLGCRLEPECARRLRARHRHRDRAGDARPDLRDVRAGRPGPGGYAEGGLGIGLALVEGHRGVARREDRGRECRRRTEAAPSRSGCRARRWSLAGRRSSSDGRRVSSRCALVPRAGRRRQRGRSPVARHAPRGLRSRGAPGVRRRAGAGDGRRARSRRSRCSTSGCPG